jgi:hypothetical protein
MRNPSYTLTRPDKVSQTASSVSHLRLGAKQNQMLPSDSSSFTLHDQKQTYSRKQPSSLRPSRSNTGVGSDMLVRDSQENRRKRPSSPVGGHDARKRTRVDMPISRPTPAKTNAFLQHNDIQRAKSRDGLNSSPERVPSSSSARVGRRPTAVKLKPALSTKARGSNAGVQKAQTIQPTQARRGKSVRTDGKPTSGFQCAAYLTLLTDAAMDETFGTALRRSERVKR